eukprot:TRINITY_DN12096_c0_g4_i1.p1 TRINITY_DN12096_c0_g4~~TRINITY_DN12096_c0_g4_i1.p1  ORF type:complete len:427 (+),score=35.56 TRINITY_DN12096_c0_g4_i1:98-1282(+)
MPGAAERIEALPNAQLRKKTGFPARRGEGPRRAQPHASLAGVEVQQHNADTQAPETFTYVGDPWGAVTLDPLTDHVHTWTGIVDARGAAAGAAAGAGAASQSFSAEDPFGTATDYSFGTATDASSSDAVDPDGLGELLGDLVIIDDSQDESQPNQAVTLGADQSQPIPLSASTGPINGGWTSREAQAADMFHNLRANGQTIGQSPHHDALGMKDLHDSRIISQLPHRDIIYTIDELPHNDIISREMHHDVPTMGELPHQDRLSLEIPHDLHNINQLPHRDSETVEIPRDVPFLGDSSYHDAHSIGIPHVRRTRHTVERREIIPQDNDADASGISQFTDAHRGYPTGNVVRVADEHVDRYVHKHKRVGNELATRDSAGRGEDSNDFTSDVNGRVG